MRTCRRRPSIPAASAFAIDLVAGIGDHHGVFELDKAARRMQQRGFHRHHLAGFQWNVGVGRRIRHRPAIGEPRRLVADQAHAVGEEFHMIVVLRFRAQRLGGGVDVAAPSRRRLIGFIAARWMLSISAEQIVKLGVGFALDRHAADVADIAVVIAAGVDRHDVALLPLLLGGRAVDAGAAGDQAIFERQPAIGFLAAQRLDHLGLGRARAVARRSPPAWRRARLPTRFSASPVRRRIFSRAGAPARTARRPSSASGNAVAQHDRSVVGQEAEFGGDALWS